MSAALLGAAALVVAADVLVTAASLVGNGRFVEEAQARRGRERDRRSNDYSGEGFSGGRSGQGESSGSRSSQGDSSGSRSGQTESSGNKSSQNEANRPDEASASDDRRSRSSGSDREQRQERRGAAKNSSRNERGKDDKAESEPPRTLVETFDRLFKPAPAATPQAVPPPASQAAKAAPRRAGAGAAQLDTKVVSTSGKSHVPGEVLAMNMSPVALQKARAKGFTVARTVPLGQSTITQLLPPAGIPAPQALEVLRADIGPGLYGLNRVYRMYRSQTQSVDTVARRTQAARPPGSAQPCVGDRCAGRQSIGWQDNLARCSAGVRIGVIDTDVDDAHPAFQARRPRKGTFIPTGRKAAPNWHGTGVLALLAGDPRSGTPGLVPNAEFFAAEIFYVEDDGGFATDTFSLLNALDWMGAWGVQVVNMSFSGPRDDIIQRKIAAMSAQGVVFVAAAGNEGPAALPGYPAAYKQVVAVTAVNKELRNFSMANRGNHIDVAAPGVDIWTAVPGSREGYYTGTSFAAPYATAVMATVYAASARKDKETLLALAEIRDLGAPGRDAVYGRGFLLAPGNCRGERVAASAPAASTTPPAPINASWSASVIGVSTTPSAGLAAGFR